MYIKKKIQKIYIYGFLIISLATLISFDKKIIRIFFLNHIENFMSYNLGFSSINNLIDDGELYVKSDDTDVLNIGDTDKIKALIKNYKKIINYQINKDKLSSIPSIDIKINFKNYKKILEDRSKAIRNNFLSNAEYVSGVLKYDDKEYIAKIRLKGDLSDHWYPEVRMSLRIKLKKNDSILGFRKFNISKPKSRQFPYDETFQSIVKKIGNMSSNSKLANIILNGKSQGIMLIEEVVSKELIEKQNRKDSMIFRFSDDRTWKFSNITSDRSSTYQYKWYRLSDPKYFARVYDEKKHLNFKTNRNVKTYVLENNINQPNILLDKEKYIKNFILAFIWNNFHIINDINHKSYWNPFTLLLEPVSFDQGPFVLINQQIDDYLNIIKKELSSHYAESLYSIKNIDELNIYIKEVAENLDEIEKVLNKNHKYFPLDLMKSPAVLKNNIDYMYKNNVKIFDWFKSLSGHQHDRFSKYIYDLPLKKNIYQKDQLEQYVHTRHYENGNILFFNLLPEEVVVENILVDGEKTEYQNIIIPGHNEKDYNPFILKTNLTGIYDNKILIKSNYKNKKTIQDNVGVTLSSSVKNPLNLNVNKEKSFLKKISKENFLLKKGNWNVETPIVLIGNLRVEEDTILNFSKDSYLIVVGSVNIKGSLNKPVIFRGNEDQWGGIYILSKNNYKSIFKNVLIKNASGINDSILKLNSGLTIYKGNVKIDNLNIEDSNTEDALNIFNSNIDIKNLYINSTFSDALDCDFCNGVIKNSKFYNILGDAIDFSGSKVSLKNITVEKVKDKGLSVGEDSDVYISDSSIENVGVGIASKDGSKTIADNVIINDYKLYAGMTYIKKSFHDNNLTSLRTNFAKKLKKNSFKRQEGTYIYLNGELLESSKINVKKMYQSEIMKK